MPSLILACCLPENFGRGVFVSCWPSEEIFFLSHAHDHVWQCMFHISTWVTDVAPLGSSAEGGTLAWKGLEESVRGPEGQIEEQRPGLQAKKRELKKHALIASGRWRVRELDFQE